MKKKHMMPLLIGAGVLYYLYSKSQTPAAPALAAVPATPAPATVAGFGFRR